MRHTVGWVAALVIFAVVWGGTPTAVAQDTSDATTTANESLSAPAAEPAESSATNEPADPADQAVYRAQVLLADHGFYRGDLDGIYGPQTAQAILAFHKAAGLERTDTWSGIDTLLIGTWDPQLPERVDEPDRVEIDLTRQVLYLLNDDQIIAVIPVSSASGNTYRNASGRTSVAHTPRGDFTLYRHVSGARYSYLGFLWRPWYFSGGYAIHGSGSVPAYPASHGCVRMPNWEADWLETHLWLGMSIHLWDSDGSVTVTLPTHRDMPQLLDPEWPTGRVSLA